jgi:hypothetical protein
MVLWYVAKDRKGSLKRHSEPCDTSEGSDQRQSFTIGPGGPPVGAGRCIGRPCMGGRAGPWASWLTGALAPWAARASAGASDPGPAVAGWAGRRGCIRRSGAPWRAWEARASEGAAARGAGVGVGDNGGWGTCGVGDNRND